MLNLMKMIMYRILHNKTFLFLPVIVTPIVIMLSIFFTNNMATNANIAIVNQSNISFAKSAGVNITYLDSTPPLSDLMQGKYDAIVNVNNDKSFDIQTIKNENFKAAIEDTLSGKTPHWNLSSKRGEISNLTGFIMMFVLLIGIMLYRFYYEEKNGIDKRILSSPITYIKYSLSHCIVVLGIVFIPMIIIILGYSLIWGFDTNMNNLDLCLIFGLMALLGSSLGLFISSIVKSDDNAVLVGAMTVISTTLLSGSFRDITSTKITMFISKILPQKYILDYAMNLENNQKVNSLGILYVLILCLLFILLSLYFNKRRLNNF